MKIKTRIVRRPGIGNSLRMKELMMLLASLAKTKRLEDTRRVQSVRRLYLPQRPRQNGWFGLWLRLHRTTCPASEQETRCQKITKSSPSVYIRDQEAHSS